MLKAFRTAVLLATALLGSVAARAQIALYGNFEANDLTQNSTFVTGGTFGLYDDFYHLGPIRLGADARGSVLSKDSTNLSKILVGVRLAVKPPILPIKPYVQFNAGIAKLTSGQIQPGYKPAYEVNGGVDLTFLPHVDWRMVEIGAGAINGQPDSEFHLATGLVFRFF